MPTGVTINSASLDRKLAQFAALSSKGLREAAEEGARRFTQNAILNTMPMILSSSPATAKREWTERVTRSFTSFRLTKQGYRKDAEVRRLLAAKKKKLGREAAGWMAAAQALKAKRVPAWVRRHSSHEGDCRITQTQTRVTIIITNSVPYNEDMTASRARYALARTERGFDGNLRAMKRKILRKAR